MDILCYAYLRWTEVQSHLGALVSAMSPGTRIFFIEPPIWHEDPDEWSLSCTQEGTWVVVPKLNQNNLHDTIYRQKQVLNHLFSQCGIHDPVLWQYTPQGLFAEPNHLSLDHLQVDTTAVDGQGEPAEIFFGDVWHQRIVPSEMI